jgi:Tol biopolymer transport system component
VRIIIGLLGHSRITIVTGYLLLVLVATACGASAPSGTEPENPTLEGSDTSAPASGTSVPGSEIPTTSAAVRFAEGREGELDLIAYSDDEGRVFLTGPQGISPSRIDPGDGFFIWPVWSPTGDRIVFSGTSLDSGEPAALYSYSQGEESPQVVFRNEPGTGAILPSMAHYPLWSPDGSRLAIVASRQEQLAMYLLHTDNPGSAEKILERAPLYASWSGDSRYLVVHGEEEHFIVDSEGEKLVTALDYRDSQYRAPAWWPSGDRYTLVVPNSDGGRDLVIEEAISHERTTFGSVESGVAFRWSPDGSTLALARSRISVGGIYDTIEFFRADGTSIGPVIDDTLIAFYWSPDSSKLAYVTLADQAGVFRWQVLDMEDGNDQFVTEFKPSGPQITLFQFFDQFSYSHQVWSPDSDALVFSGRPVGGVISDVSGLLLGSQILVASLDQPPSILPIASGAMGFWSPR